MWNPEHGKRASDLGQPQMDAISEMLSHVRRKGIRLWAENGELRYKAPKGALSEMEIESLRASKGRIVALLERRHGARATAAKLVPRAGFERIPLTFPQLAHWNLYRLAEKPAIRQIASATRLHGKLNMAALERSLGEVVRRHEALRARISVRHEIPELEITASSDCVPRLFDLTNLPEDRCEAKIREHIEACILEPVDLARDPLLAAHLLKLADEEHVLLLAIEHIVSDAVSMGILLRELFVVYEQIARGEQVALPQLEIQFGDYAVWHEKAYKSWTQQHGAYWSERLNGHERLSFPADPVASSASRSGWGTVTFRIDSAFREQLQEWAQLRKTTLVMTAFAAYVALVLRWCNASLSVVQFQSDGRIHPEILSTIGYFASVLYLPVELRETDSFIELLNRVSREYCGAYEYIDFAYLQATLPRPPCAQNTAFNWIPRPPVQSVSDRSQSDGSLRCAPIPFHHPMLRTLENDQEPAIVLHDTGVEVAGQVHFSLRRHSTQTMDRFVQSYLTLIRQCVKDPESPVPNIALP